MAKLIYKTFKLYIYIEIFILIFLSVTTYFDKPKRKEIYYLLTEQYDKVTIFYKKTKKIINTRAYTF